jgi:protein transport protein SEC13
LASAPGGALAARIASGGCDQKVRVWTFGEGHELQDPAVDLADEEGRGHIDWVRDVAWAPSIGLSHNILATASQDRTVIIWIETVVGQQLKYVKKAQVCLPAVVWRCSWSVTGSILAASCGDNKVYLLKESADGSTWEIVSTVDEN